ncbi:alpha/beta fold hydrolase [Singulisphaera acidiphila]|uniref:Putative hydrolase or acyltransferase of alpha/beta superfamily n=1 Tax=Singulisphaera acidiphila (strain ATCC BAA-1392 / DSM 18658 / VKM B-2454 / MOB10) TaxID=886293 RepID=L0D9S5_SINAD|nr:alpha/beta fold hydrolase [Singulisphaera acidiphila]AGA25588.1 putative hydrolase or acyltransferase of alpha/beta superfamily [Singulisphaera acidiphila DSM 18658]
MLLDFDDDGPGPVVILLHGFPLNRSMWKAQMAKIGSLYRVIAPDLRGHGHTAAPDGVYSIDAMADDVLDLLNALQLKEPVVIGGLSMGGYIALSLVARHPERVRALILMDTRAGADSTEAALGREEMAKQVETTRSTASVVQAMLPKLFSETTRNFHSDRIVPVRHMMEKTPARAVAGALRGMAARPDRTGDLARIQVPTLVLVGADDTITPPAEARAMAQAIPGAQFEIIPNAGHLAPLENPAASNAAILRFLSSLP